MFEGVLSDFAPESNGGNPPHESVGSDTLQVEKGTIEKQQQDNILTDDEAPSTLPDQWDVLVTYQRATTYIISITNSTST